MSAPGRAFAWYPFVGLHIGLLLVGAAWLLGHSGLGVGVQAGLILLLWVMITGGLHLDGVMDSCDALFAPVGVERRLEILKDVHPGAFGVIGLALVLGLKWALLADLLPRAGGWPLLLAPVWGRWMLVWAASRFPYARSGAGLGSRMRAGLSDRELWIAGGFALACQALALSGHPLLAVLLAPPLAGLLLARWAARRLGGGLTGDLYGFLCESVEVLVLLAGALLVGPNPL